MKLTKEIRGEIALLSCHGEFDSFVVNPFLEQVESLMTHGVKAVVLNMRLVKFINSTAIGSIIKCRKQLKAKGGDLVISTPSNFVADVLDTLGLTRVIRVFEDDEAAIEGVQPQDGVSVPQKENTIMVNFTDAEKQKALGKTPCVGKITALDEDGVLFTVPAPPDPFESGASIKVKFRLPLYKKSYYFEIPSRVERAEAVDEGARVRVSFSEISEENRQSISQFVADLKMLREEIKDTD